MKSLKFKYIFILLLFPWASCSDFVEGDTNVSPNSATDAPLSSLITAAQVYLYGTYTSEDARLANMWTQQFTGSDRQYSSYYNYLVTSEVFDFGNSYVGIIQPTLDAEARAEEQGNTVTIGMLKVMRAMAFGRLTSLYGDIPFSEANQYPEVENPKYDAQSDVYAGLQTMLSSAISDLNSGKGGIATDDIYGGDPDLWIEAAHTLKARYFVHVGDLGNAKTEAGMGISAPENDLNAHFGTTVSANQNPWYDFAVIQRSGYLTATNSYLRRSLTASEGEYRGNAKTDETERLNYIYSGLEINTSELGMFAQDGPLRIVSYYENQLILAEALMDEGDATGALAALNNVRAELALEFPSGTYDAYTLADFAGGGIANVNGGTAAEELMLEIHEEKYTTLVGQLEVFVDFLRLDNPLGLTPASGSAFPERFLYPTDEVNSNGNVPDPLPGLFDPMPVNM